MVDAVGTYGLARTGSSSFRPSPGNALSMCQLHRPIPVLQNRLSRKTSASGRYSYLRCGEVRRDQLSIGSGDCVHG